MMLYGLAAVVAGDLVFEMVKFAGPLSLVWAFILVAIVWGRRLVLELAVGAAVVFVAWLGNLPGRLGEELRKDPIVLWMAGLCLRCREAGARALRSAGL